MFSFISNHLLLEQLTVIVILVVSLFLFIQDRWRYDVVAFLILLSLIFVGILPYETAFSNFGHPAIIIVASMFVLGRALVLSGVVETIVGKLTFLHHRPIFTLGVLVILVTSISAFVNNLGALVMVLPIAIHLAKKNKTPIALYLLPLAFASHLGGYLTLIGTPRNILISDFREEALGVPYEMFDFFLVGFFIAFAGALYLIFISWRMIRLPKINDTQETPIRIYTTEITVPPSSKITQSTIYGIEAQTNNTIKITGIFSGELFDLPFKEYKPVEGDKLQLQGDAEALSQFVQKYGLVLDGLRATEQYLSSDDEHKTIEAVVTPYATIIGKSWNSISLQERFGVNFIGIARRDATFKKLISETQIYSGDILMTQGRVASVKQALTTFNCMIVSDNEITLGRSSTIIGTLVIFIGAIILATLEIFPIAAIFLTAAILLVITNLISIKQAYESIDVAVLVLLAGMISLGDAIQLSGADKTLADLMLSINGWVGPITMLIIILFATAILSDFMNTTAALVVMAPVAIMIANTIGVSIDPFLMIVAIGASSSFMTPIGHESNAFVMHKGGYKFSDYIRIGLPLELIEYAVSVPLVLYFWPL